MTDSILDAAPWLKRRSASLAAASDGRLPPFIDLVRNFNKHDQPSREIRDGSIPYLINEFWTAGQRQAHSITR